MKQIYTLLLFSLLAVSLNAQPGFSDSSFNPFDDCTYGAGTSFDAVAMKTIVLPDGKIIVVGSFQNYNGVAANRIVRLNSDGSVDPSFNIGTGFDAPAANLALQPDGKIVIVGYFTSYNGTLANRIIRLNSDGTPDVTFNTGSGLNNFSRSLELQPDGKIIVGGYFTSYNGNVANRVVRLNSNGSIDFTFNTGTACDGEVLATAVQPDGKVLLGGTFLNFNGTLVNRIVRLNADGSLDASFITGSGFGSAVWCIEVQNDGKLIIGGTFTIFNGTPSSKIARLNVDGTFDSTFMIGSGFDERLYQIIILPDTKILLAGLFTSFNGSPINRIVRLNLDGTIDGSFNPGSGFNDLAFGIALQPDGDIVTVGDFTSFNGISLNRITRLNSDGTRDILFNPSPGFSGITRAAAIQSDQKIIIGGDFVTYNSESCFRIARLNVDGSLDLTFNTGTGFNNSVHKIVIQQDGKILVGGNFTSFNGTSINRIARLNVDGSLDLTFNPGTGFNNNVKTIAIQSDGKIVVGGYYTSFNGTSMNRLSRLNIDGSLDLTFGIGTGFNSDVSSIVIQSDEKILVGGAFTTYNGISKFKITRLNSDGTSDLTFDTGAGFNSEVHCLALQQDGKILVGGHFNLFNGIIKERYARLNINGSLDTTFNTAPSGSAMPYTIVAQDNGKILIGGNFDYYNYSPASGIARANPDGSTNTSFDSGSGFGPGFTTPVYEIVVQNDGKIITVGDFTTYNGNCRNYIARLEDPCFGLYSTSIVDTTVCEFFEGNWGQIYSTSGTYLEVISNYLGCDSTIIYNVTIVNSTASNITISGCDLASLNSTDYFTSGTYTQIIPNSVGCDSTITVDVEIYESTFSVIDHTTCESFNLNGTTYNTGGTFIQTIPNSLGCDSTITLNLTLIPSPINVAVTQAGIFLLSLETVGTFQWLDCNNGYSEIPGENLVLFGAPTIGSFAVKIEQSGCVDTSSCFDIDSSDFYGTPGYVPLYAEVFAFPVTNIDSCDAASMAFVSGGVPPYTYDWYTQSNNENSDFPDSLCYGIHTLKVVDAIGDSTFVDYYVTDTANFNMWYDTLFTGFVDTIYVNAPNCLLNYSLPLDSGEITQLLYIGPDTIATFELLFIEFTYFQGGTAYVHQDTISMASDSWSLIYFSVYCPIKSSTNVKSMLFGFSTSTLSSKENDSRIPIKVFPNPTHGNFTVENLPQYAVVELWTASGQILFVGSASNGKFEFNLAEYSDGIYFVRVLSEGIITNVKLVKH